MANPNYKYLFSRELLRLVNEIFPAHGITEMDDEQYDQMIIEITQQAYYPILQEIHHTLPETRAVPLVAVRW